MDNIYTILKLGRIHKITKEYILTYEEVLEVLGYILHSKSALILGGDVLNSYDEYIYANWNYEPSPSLSWIDNVKRSFDCSYNYIHQLDQYKSCLYILVLAFK